MQHARQGSQDHRSYSTQQPCQICSYTQPYPAEQKRVFHTHFSSLRHRELTGVEGTDNSYLCPSCKSSHAPNPEDRIKLVISDSSLHKFFDLTTRRGSGYPGDMLHVDYITIPEGCIEDLVHAFRLDYELADHHKPLDVVVVAGYNDLLRNNSRTFIMEGFKHLSDLVQHLGKDKPPEKKNSFAVASLLYPPCLAWFADNGRRPGNFQNRLGKIDWLNKHIHELNISNSVADYPRFHTYGVRTTNRKKVDMYGEEYRDHIKSHRWEHWDEKSRVEKLNLVAERKFKMGTALSKYFSLNTS